MDFTVLYIWFEVPFGEGYKCGVCVVGHILEKGYFTLVGFWVKILNVSIY